jgi:hypothetical protein
MSTSEHSPLSEEDRRTLAELRRQVAEHKARGRWQTDPIADPEKFADPIGLDQDGNIRSYRSLDEFRAAMERPRAAEAE